MGILRGRYGGRTVGRSARLTRLATTRRQLRALVLLSTGCVVLLLTTPGRGTGQTLGAPAAPGGPQLPAWLTRWSPVGLVGDMPRELPGGNTSLPDLLTVPTPRVGSFWTAGNPAGLPSDVDDSYSQIRLGYRDSHGSYRRPLDPGSDVRIGGTALGWKKLAGNGAAIGRIVVDRVGYDDGAHGDVVLPHSSNPFVVLDTLGDAVSSIVTRLDGAGGWQIGALGLGIALGYDGREMRTVQSPAPRQQRVSAAGASAGVEYELMDGAVRIGAYGTREQLVQEFSVYSYAQATRVYAVSGYYDPLPLDLNNNYYWRRLERHSTALGGSLGGDVAGVRWTVFVQKEGLTERQSIAMEDEPPVDEWGAEGWTAGLGVQFSLSDSLLLVTAMGEYATLTGSADRMDLEEMNFDAEEAEWYVGVEVRLPQRGAWSGAVRLRAGRQDRRRYDYLSRVGSDLSSWAPAAALEIARALPAGFTLSAGIGYAQHAPWGSLPNASRMDPAYQVWIAPELAIYGNGASALSGALALRWYATPLMSLWARGATSSLTGETGVGSLPEAPDGSRKHISIEVGVTWGGGR